MILGTVILQVNYLDVQKIQEERGKKVNKINNH
jgi:hypothetical protein